MAVSQSPVQVSSKSLSREQLDFYADFFQDYRKLTDSSDTINLAELTGILQPDEGDYAGCMRGFSKIIPQQVHRWPATFVHNHNLNLVDPTVVHRNIGLQSSFGIRIFPHSTSSTDEIPQVPQKPDSAFTLSEIIFDRKHHRAALNVSFEGVGFGGSSTQVYEYRKGHWHHSNRYCVTGIS
ncbi:MAG: hypothetical protein ABI197_01810 [Granulicella sp.]